MGSGCEAKSVGGVVRFSQAGGAQLNCSSARCEEQAGGIKQPLSSTPPVGCYRQHKAVGVGLSQKKSARTPVCATIKSFCCAYPSVRKEAQKTTLWSALGTSLE